jgi:hypothetical protein
MHMAIVRWVETRLHGRSISVVITGLPERDPIGALTRSAMTAAPIAIPTPNETSRVDKKSASSTSHFHKMARVGD